MITNSVEECHGPGGVVVRKKFTIIVDNKSSMVSNDLTGFDNYCNQGANVICAKCIATLHEGIVKEGEGRWKVRSI